MIKIASSCVLTIVLMNFGLAHAVTGVSKDWTWKTDKADLYFAITTNSEKHVLGQYCYIAEGICFYVVSLDIDCEPGSTYPAMVNSDKGADHLVLKCIHKYKGQNILAIYEFEQIDVLVRTAAHLGIAIPVANDRFEVIRFNLIGSSVAIEQMRNAAKTAVDTRSSPKNTHLPDEELI